MAEPTTYTPDFDFTATNKGTEINVELQNISESTGSLAAAISDVRRSDGALQNQIVTEDSLAPGLRDALVDGAISQAAASAASAAADREQTGLDRVAAGNSEDAAAGSALEAATYDPTFRFADVSLLLASTRAAGGEGTIWQAGSFLYEEAASGATDQHVTTAGGVKLYVLPRNNVLPMLALSPAADGVTNDAAKIALVNTAGQVVDLGGKDYEFGGVFAPTATIINGMIIDDNRTYDYRLVTRETATTVGQRRSRINYDTATSVRVDGIPDRIAMGGFRFMGQYLKSQGRLVPTGLGAASHAAVDITTQLAGLNASASDNWYAVFACSNPDDPNVSFRLVPYFRCSSLAGNVVTLGHGGENKNAAPATQTYDMATNAFAGVDCLVIQQGGIFSGRITTITANDTTTITLADGTGIAQLDFLLPAPPGFSEYHYLGTAYREAPGDWRNIADSGARVNSRMVNADEVLATGAASNAKIRFGGNISPLATGYIGSLSEALSTTSLGLVAETLAHDGSSHDIWRCLIDKDVSDNKNANFMVELSFSKEQAAWLNTSGTLAATVVSRTMLTYGWVEP